MSEYTSSPENKSEDLPSFHNKSYRSDKESNYFGLSKSAVRPEKSGKENPLQNLDVSAI